MAQSYAEDSTHESADRVRRSTDIEVNNRIDRRTDANIASYSSLGREAVLSRIDALDREWDVERILEVIAPTLALSGVVLGVTVNKKWLLVPGVVLSFLLQHGLQGWCPPLPILRRLGVRTRGEIDREKYALKAVLDRSLAP